MHIEKLTSNEKIWSIDQAFHEHSADKLVVRVIIHFWNWGQWCKCRDIGQNIQILIKTQGWFYSDF